LDRITISTIKKGGRGEEHIVDESFDEMWEVIGAKIVKSNLVFLH